MIIKRYPNGSTLIGVSNTTTPQKTNLFDEDYPVGMVQVVRQDNSTSSLCYATVTVPTGSSYTSETLDIGSTGFGSTSAFSIKADVYIKDDIVKFKIITQVYESSIVSEKVLGYVFPTGTTSDLSGYKKITSIQAKTDYGDAGGYLFNLINPDGDKISDCSVNSTMQIVITSGGAGTLKSAEEVMLEIQTVTNDLTDTIDDIRDTVSDLSSESAAKFVSR